MVLFSQQTAEDEIPLLLPLFRVRGAPSISVSRVVLETISSQCANCCTSAQRKPMAYLRKPSNQQQLLIFLIRFCVCILMEYSLSTAQTRKIMDSTFKQTHME